MTYETSLIELYTIKDVKEPSLKKLLHQWFEENGRGVTHANYTTHHRHTKGVYSYWYIKKKMDALRERNILTWQLVSQRSGGEAEISAELDKKKKWFKMLYHHQEGWFDPKKRLKLIQDLMDHITPTYGMVHTHSSKDQGYFLKNTEKDLYAQEEEERIKQWEQYYSSSEVREDTFKDLYTTNIVSKGHLDRMIEGVRLEEWIKGDQERGTLLPLTKDLTLWEVKKKNISKIRPQFKNLMP